MSDEYGYDGDTEQTRERDPRVTLTERLVGLEGAHRSAQINAKEAAVKAQKIATEIANVQNELYKLLGVVSEDEARATRVAVDR